MRNIKLTFLTMLMALFALPAFAQDFTYEGITYTVLDAETLTCRTKIGFSEAAGNTYEGDLVIPSVVSYEGTEYTVVEIGNYGFTKTGLTSITLPESVTVIEEHAFDGCTDLASAALNNSITVIKYGAFYECSNLASLMLPEKLNEIGEYAFGKCSSLTSLSIPESVTVLGAFAFDQCRGLASVTLPTNLTSISSGLFCNCSGLASISIPEGVTSIGASAFSQCSGLTSIILPKNLISIGSMAFQWDTALTSIYIPESVTSVGRGAFSECSSLTTITLPKSLTTVEEFVFDNCSSIEEITYNAETPITAPENIFKEFVYGKATLNMPNATLAVIRDYVPWNKFSHIIAQNGSIDEGFNIGKFIYEGINYTVIDSDAKTCRTKEGSSNTGVTISGNEVTGDLIIPSVVSDGIDEYTVVEIGELSFDGNKITSVSLPNTVTAIKSFSFSNCYDIVSVELPEDLKEIGYMAFYNCNSLATVTYNTSSPITAPDNVFDEAGYLNANLIMPNAQLDDILNNVPWNKFHRIEAKDANYRAPLEVGEDFEYEGIIYTVIDKEAMTCRTKSSSSGAAGNSYEGDLIIPAYATFVSNQYSVVEIGSYGFYTTGVTSISLPETLTVINDHAFYDCDKVVSVSLPKSLVSIGEAAFAGCSSMTTITLPESLEYLGASGFAGCVKLESISIPQPTTSIEERTFVGCFGLKSVTLHDALKSIGQYAFYRCQNMILTSAELPSSLTQIGDGAFRECSSLTSIVLPQSLTALNKGAFMDCNNITSVSYNAITPLEAVEDVFSSENDVIYNDATLNMPNATLADIQATVPWNMFQHIVAKDGSVGMGPVAGEDFEYQGIKYTVIDAEAKTCKTREGFYPEEGGDPSLYYSGNECSGVVEIPEVAYSGDYGYTVVEIGKIGFEGNTRLSEIILPNTIKTIGYYAFGGCSGLLDINFPDSLTSIGKGAFNLTGVTNVKIPESVEFIGEMAFLACQNLESIEFPESCEFENYGTGMVSNCQHLKSVILPKNMTNIGWFFFSNCHALEEIVLPDAIEIIGPEAFMRCSSLSRITLPKFLSQIEQDAFSNCSSLTSITLPESMTNLAPFAFLECNNLTSLVFEGENLLDGYRYDEIGNPNLMIFASAQMETDDPLNKNIAVRNGESGEYECANLVLTPGYPFKPIYAFNATHSSLTKEFTQETPIEGCAGWETLVLPFDVTEITASDSRSLTPFANFVKTSDQCPFWLYEANSNGGWLESSQIKAGVPYIISMPNNGEYDAEYCISGDVTFSSSSPMSITPETTAPYAVTWASGREFRSLWTPLTEEEAANAMGLNVGISNLVGDNGEVLAPGSAFHVGVVPQPLEAYVTRIDGQRAMKIGGGQSSVLLIDADRNLDVRASYGTITVTSATDRTLDICTTDGMRIRTLDLKAGETVTVTDLTKGIYIVANRKVTVK